MKMNNIKSFKEYINEWHTIEKDNDGNITIDNDKKINTYGLKLIDRAVLRAENDVMDKICGGLSSIETEMSNKLSNDNPESLQDRLGLIASTKVGECGYVDINCDDTIFKINPSSIGRGEVLLAWTYKDVRMKNREFGETGDCAIYDINSNEYSEENILYNIEVKSGGSEFALRNPVENNDYAEAIYQHILTRYRKNGKPLIFIFFDNNLKNPGHNTCNGFFWIYCGTKTADHTTIKKVLQDKISDTVKYDYTKPKNGLFAIEFKSPNAKNEEIVDKFIIHTRKKSEV